MHALAAFLLSLPLAALAGSHVAPLHRRRHNVQARNVTHARRGVTYTLEDDFSGNNFFKYAPLSPVCALRV